MGRAAVIPLSLITHLHSELVTLQLAYAQVGYRLFYLCFFVGERAALWILTSVKHAILAQNCQCCFISFKLSKFLQNRQITLHDSCKGNLNLRHYLKQ